MQNCYLQTNELSATLYHVYQTNGVFLNYVHYTNLRRRSRDLKITRVEVVIWMNNGIKLRTEWVYQLAKLKARTTPTKLIGAFAPPYYICRDSCLEQHLGIYKKNINEDQRMTCLEMFTDAKSSLSIHVCRL